MPQRSIPSSNLPTLGVSLTTARGVSGCYHASTRDIDQVIGCIECDRTGAALVALRERQRYDVWSSKILAERAVLTDDPCEKTGECLRGELGDGSGEAAGWVGQGVSRRDQPARDRRGDR